MGINLDDELIKSGYRLFGHDGGKEKLILNLLETKDIRYLKTIPYLIYMYDLDVDKIHEKTKSKDLFEEIVLITKFIFEENKIKRTLPQYDLKLTLNKSDFKHDFEMQLSANKKPDLILEKQQIYGERDLQDSLSKLFTKKEKEIIKDILDGVEVSKTEYEYYSRRTKKKFQAIINVYELAKILSLRTPKLKK